MDTRLKRVLSLVMAVVMVIGMMPTNIAFAEGVDESETPATCEHSYAESVTKDATCTEAGEKSFTCSACGDSYSEVIAATGHSYAETVTKAATCTEAGEKAFACSVCGDSYTDVIAATGHSYAETVTKAATCTEAGEKSFACSVCGDSYNEVIAATGHSYAEEVTKAATCTEAGEKSFACSVCGDSYNEVIAATGHSYAEEVTKVATCTEAGEKSFACSVCGDSYNEVIAATGHSYAEEVTKAATCTEAGEKSFTCSVCGDSYTEAIPVTKHNYVDGKCACDAVDPDWAPDETTEEPAEDPLVVQVQKMLDALPELPPVVTKAELEAYQIKVNEITAILVTMTKEQTDQLTGLEKLYPNVTLEETNYVAIIGSNRYATFPEALTAAAAMSGDVNVEIYDKVTLNTSLSGSYNSIKFVGKNTDAEIYLDVQGYITATGKKVAFEDLKLSKSEGGFIDNAGFMNVAFGVYDVLEVTYDSCTFENGAYASSGDVTFTECTFKHSHDKYGLWAYGDANIVVEKCVFDNDRGIKMYAEDKAKTTDLTVKNSDFSKLTGKPAIVLTYGESVTLVSNNYSTTGTFELDLDGAPNGTTVTSDVAPTCTNDNGACGVLVDGKIYTTVAQAADAATSGSTVTLLHNSTEIVELPEGVTLDKNGFEAAGVTVPVTVPGAVATKAELNAAIAAAAPGDVITLTADIDYGTDHLKIEKAITLDLGGKTLTTRARNYGLALYNGCTVTNGKLNHAGTVAAIKVWDANEISDLEIDVTGTSSSGNTIDGIVIQENAVGVDTIKNVTIHSTAGQGVDSGIKTHNCGNADADVIGSMENVTVDAKSIGLNISAPCGTATNCDIKGGKSGIEIWIKGTYNASLNLVDCDVTGGVNAHDEYTSDPNAVNSGSLSLTVDAATTGASVEDVTLTIARADENKVEGVLENVIEAAVAKIGDTYYTSLVAAIKAAGNGATITLLDGNHTMPIGTAVNLQGKTLTFKGTRNAVIDATVVNENDQYVTGANLSFEGVTLNFGKVNYMGFANCASLTYKDCAINGLQFASGSGVMTFENCDLNSNGAEHCVWTWGGENIIFTDCKFTYGDRAVNCYGERVTTNVTFTNCTFTKVAGQNATGAIETNSSALTALNLVINNCSVNEGELWWISTYDSKGGANTTVYKDSKLVWPDAVAKIGNKEYGSLQKAIAAAQNGETVELLTDVTEEVEITDGKTVVIDLKGKTLNGAIKPSKADLTVQNGSIINTNVSYSAIEINEGKLTLTGVKITSARHGVRIDGAVEATIDGGEYRVNYTKDTRHALNVSGAANVTIKDGIFVGPAGTTMDSGAAVNVQTGATVTIEGGSFSGGKNHTLGGSGTIIVIGGNFDQDPTAYVAAGYEAVKEGENTWKVGKIKIAEVNGVQYESLEAAVEAAAAEQSGVEIKMLNDVTLDATVTLPAGVIFNGNGKVITGTIMAGGDLTFKEKTTVTMFSAGFSGYSITIDKGACLEITDTNRMTLGYGNTFNIIGEIENDKTTIQPSLVVPNGISITGGNGLTLNVTNAYVKLGSTTSKNSVANGKFTLNFNNAIAEFTSQLTFTEPTNGKTPEFVLNVKDSVLTTGTKLCVAAPNSTVVIDNSTVTLGDYLRNSGELTLKNGSVLTGSMIQFGENGGNDGTITVDASTMTIKNTAVGHAMDGKDTGKLILKNGATASVDHIIKTVIELDATSSLTSKDEQLVVNVPTGYEVMTSKNADNLTVYAANKLPVAKVGDTEYKYIDDAIAAWTNNTTLTLLADVTLSDVVKIKSTEHHILNLGTFTMTAAEGKNAIEITCEGRNPASYALTINADAQNPGGITATGKACIYYKKTDTTKDRPIIVINNGVFNGSYSINSVSNGNTNCPQFRIYGGTFNGNVNLTKNLLQVYGGTFNGWINCTGDQNAYREIHGGSFKQWQFMTADNALKFAVGTVERAQGNGLPNKPAVYDVGMYIDDSGYLVVGGPVVTESGTTYEASTTYSAWSNYLQYSSANANGLYWTSLDTAMAKKPSGKITVHISEKDLTGTSFMGTLLLPTADSTLTVTFAEGTEPAWKVGTELDGYETTYTESVADGTVTRVYKTFVPAAKIGDTYYETFEDALAVACADSSITKIEICNNSTQTVVKNTSSYYDITGNLTIAATEGKEYTVKVDVPGDKIALRIMGDGATLTIAENVTIEGMDVVANGFATQNENMIINGTLKAVSLKQWTNNGEIAVNGNVELGYGDGQFDMAYGNGTVTVNGNGNKTTVQFKAGYSGTRGNGNTLNLKDTYFEGGAWFNMNGSNGTINADNSLLKVSGGDAAGSITITSSGNKINLTNGSELNVANLTIGADNTVELDATSSIKATKLSGAGKIIIDATGMVVGEVPTITGDASNFTGVIEVVGETDLLADIVDGKIVLVNPVAKIGETGFKTVAEALEAANDGDTVVLVSGENIISMAGSVVGGKTVTITGTAIVDWTQGNLYIGRGGEGNGTVIFDGANITSSVKKDPASTGFHVSGNKGGDNSTNNGVLVIRNSNIEVDYLINRNETFVEGNSKLTVYGGCYTHGRNAAESGVSGGATATMTIDQHSTVIVVNENGMGVGGEGNGVMHVMGTYNANILHVSSIGTVYIENGSLNIDGDVVNNGAIYMDHNSRIDASRVTGNGEAVINTDEMSVTGEVLVISGNCTNANIEATTASIREDKLSEGVWVYFEAMVDGENSWKGYATLAKAVEAAKNGETVRITRDVTLNEPIIVEGKSISIGNVDGDHTITATVADVFTVRNGGVLNLDWLKINSVAGILWAEANGTINVNGGELKTDGRDSVTAAAFAEGAVINIRNNAVVTNATSSAITAQNKGVVNVYDSHIETTHPDFCAGFSATNGVINLMSGTVKAADDYSLIAAADGEVNVFGGNIENGVKAHESANAKVNISGGYIHGQVTTDVVTGDDEKIYISGGWFEKNPAKDAGVRLAEGMIWNGNEERNEPGWIVHGTFVAFIDTDKNGELDPGETGYTTLADAVYAAKAGDTVALLNYNELTEALSIDKSITLDVNGYTVSRASTGNSNDAAVYIKGGNVTITDSSSGNTGGVYGGFLHTIFVDNDATVNLDDVNIDSEGVAVLAMNNATVNVGKNTNVTVFDSDATSGDAIRAYGKAKINIASGANVVALDNSGQNPSLTSGSAVEIYDEVVVNVAEGANLSGQSAVKIYGGSLTSAGNLLGYESAIETSTNDGNNKDSVTNPVITINGGDISAPENKWALYLTNDTTIENYAPEVSITAGNFTGKIEIVDDIVDQFIKGGSFSNTGMDYATFEKLCAPGYVAEGDNGNYEVREQRVIDFSAYKTTDMSGVWVDGVWYPVDDNGKIVIAGEMAEKKNMFITDYAYDSSDAGLYATSMTVWLATGDTVNEDGRYDSYSVKKVDALNNFFVYEGTSIRVSSAKNGIRFFTSVDPSLQNALVSGTTLENLGDVKFERVGTVFRAPRDGEFSNDVVLPGDGGVEGLDGQTSDVYGGKVSKNFRVFAQTEAGRNLYTGVLVNLENNPEMVGMPIYSRPYAQFMIDGEAVSLYGGMLERSIYSVALQNVDEFEPGSAHDEFIKQLIAMGESGAGEG